MQPLAYSRTDYDVTGIVLHDDITFELIDLGLGNKNWRIEKT
jgi:hypothetical protein